MYGNDARVPYNNISFFYYLLFFFVLFVSFTHRNKNLNFFNLFVFKDFLCNLLDDDDAGGDGGALLCRQRFFTV